MKLTAQTTAFLTLDLQNGILGMVEGAEAALGSAAKATEFARKIGFHLIHVGLGFSEGHPEIADVESPFLQAKKNGLFVKGTPSAEFHSSVYQPGDLVIYKHRVSAFSHNHLQLVLRSQKIDTLVMYGVATSGIVLSTLRQAFDLDYRSVVLKDACFDRDPEVHRMLTEKVFDRQAHVVTVDAFIAEQG